MTARPDRLPPPPARGAALLPALALLISIAGCTTFSADGGFDAVSQAARERLGKDIVRVTDDQTRDTVARRVEELLARPLSVDDAVQIALLNHRGLQASFAELRISEAELVQAGRLPNPTFSMLRASRLEGGVRDYKIEQALTFNVFSLFTLPQVTKLERRRFEQTRHRVVLDMMELAADVRRAYFDAVAAGESRRYAGQVAQAADAGAELAARMAQAGNWNRLRLAREQGFQADAVLRQALAQQRLVAARERLTRLLGLWGAQTAFELPQRLPDLPAEPVDRPDVEQAALQQRIDIRMLREQTEALAANLGLTRTTRFINVLELGPARVLEGPRDSGYKNGYEVSLELPLFDWGGARVERAEALYRQSLDTVAQAAIEARSQVREAWHAYRSGYDVARHYRDDIVPLRKRIGDENLLRYNAMQIGVFELLADARAQIASVDGYIDTLKTFWIAQSDLEMVMVGRRSAASASSRSTVEAAVAAQPAAH